MDGTTRTKDGAQNATFTKWCMNTRYNALLDAGKIQVDAFKHAMAWDFLHQAYANLSALNSRQFGQHDADHHKTMAWQNLNDVHLTYLKDAKSGYLDYAKRCLISGSYLYAMDAIRIFLDDKGA